MRRIAPVIVAAAAYELLAGDFASGALRIATDLAVTAAAFYPATRRSPLACAAALATAVVYSIGIAHGTPPPPAVIAWAGGLLTALPYAFWPTALHRQIAAPHSATLGMRPGARR